MIINLFLEQYELYKYPVTTSQGCGWWSQHEPLKRNMSWAYVPRQVKINSEMTRYELFPYFYTV